MARIARRTTLVGILHDLARRVSLLERPYPASGTATLAAGGATVACPIVTPSSVVVLAYTGATSSPGHLYYSAGTGSFTINSTSGIDASRVAWKVVG